MKAVDLFAGWGGFTCGAEMAGLDVVWAANHWALAVATHAANHPHTEHVCQDLRQADWTTLPEYNVLLASPACQGHSTASQPRRRLYHDALRATAWAVVDCAEVTRPAHIVVENVPAFERWQLFPLWLEALHTLGYRTQLLHVMASWHGVAQRRQRLVIIAQQGKAPNVRGACPPRREPAFEPLLEADADGWRPISGAAPGALERFRRARSLLGPRFLSQHVTGHPGVRLSEPIRTITTKDQWVIVDGDRYRPLTLRELARGMSFPDTFTWPEGTTRVDGVKGLGNAVPPYVARDVLTEVVSPFTHGA